MEMIKMLCSSGHDITYSLYTTDMFMFSPVLPSYDNVHN